MNKGQAIALKKMIGDAAKRLREDLEPIFETIDDNAVPFELRGEAPTAIDIGKLVQVFAVCADMHGCSVSGDEGRVVEIHSGFHGPGTIVVEILAGPHRGMRFDVYPQQCIVLDAKG